MLMSFRCQKLSAIKVLAIVFTLRSNYCIFTPSVE